VHQTVFACATQAGYEVILEGLDGSLSGIVKMHMQIGSQFPFCIWYASGWRMSHCPFFEGAAENLCQVSIGAAYCMPEDAWCQIDCTLVW
jgi:hypothetical protein